MSDAKVLITASRAYRAPSDRTLAEEDPPENISLPSGSEGGQPGQPDSGAFDFDFAGEPAAATQLCHFDSSLYICRIML